MFKILKYLKPYWWRIIILIAANFVNVWAALQLPNLMSNIINDGIVGSNIGAVWHNGWQMLVITLIGGLATVLGSYLSARVGAGFGRTLRRKVFAKVEGFSMNEINKFSTASLITRSTNDCQTVQMTTIMLLNIALRAPLMAIWAIVEAVGNAPHMTWTIVLAVVVLLSVVGVLIAFVMPKFKILQKTVDKLNLLARENLTGLRVVRAFNNEKIEEAKFDRANGKLFGLYKYVQHGMSFLQPTMQMVMSMMSLLIVWVGAHYVEAGSLGVGNMIAFIQYSMQVVGSFLMLAVIFVMVPRAQVSAGRINEVLTTKNSIPEPKRKTATPKDGAVAFDHVTFRYPDAEDAVLKDISFTARPGATTAFIGSTGSGKSTLINLVPRFYDVTGGSVSIGGVDVRKLTHGQIVERIGYVPQKGVLFSGTIESNMKFGRETADQKAINKAIKIAQAREFVDKYAEGLEHGVAQGGTNVSGGQKQRLSIARAVVRDPAIYIFDDSFSALDFKTDRKLREALKPVTKKATVLIVAQRISTIMDADQIVVLDEGKVAGIGTHAELLLKCPTYRSIAESQFSDDEMKNEIKKAKDGLRAGANSEDLNSKKSARDGATSTARSAANPGRFSRTRSRNTSVPTARKTSGRRGTPNTRTSKTTRKAAA
jgi:ATP-binding cassette subfamily B protein